MHLTSRRDVLAVMAALSGLAPAAVQAAESSDPATPDWDARFQTLQASGRLAGVHAVVALRHGRIVFERYMPGRDSSRGSRLGEVDFGPDTLHDMRSVTKSVVGLLYGIALAAGQAPGPDQPLLAQFPEYPDLAADPQRAKLTVGHALTMTLGLEWDEDLPYTDPANSETAMDMAPDRYRFVLERRVVAPPGTGWIYCGGAPALLARLIEKGTGQDVAAFATATLFEPLGIARSDWHRGDHGEALAASGLRLTPRDLAKIGQLVLQDGQWDGRTIVPRDWLAASFTPAAMVDDLRRYGYLWYVGDFAIPGRAGVHPEHWVGAVGNGGQRLFVLPGRDFALAITAGNYDQPDQWRPPTAILREVFLAV